MARHRAAAVRTQRRPPRARAPRRRWQRARRARAATRQQCARRSMAWRQPSLEPFGAGEEDDAGRDDEADRTVGSGQVVAFGELVDQLAEAAEIDQEFDADDVDHGEDEPQSQTDEYRGQRGRQQDLPELLRWRQAKTAADVDEHP